MTPTRPRRPTRATSPLPAIEAAAPIAAIVQDDPDQVFGSRRAGTQADTVRIRKESIVGIVGGLETEHERMRRDLELAAEAVTRAREDLREAEVAFRAAMAALAGKE
jgi:hypothetical protein